MNAIIVILYCLVLVAVGNLFAASSSPRQRSLNVHTRSWIVAMLALSTAAMVLQAAR
jgi:hypothetical protein